MVEGAGLSAAASTRPYMLTLRIDGLPPMNTAATRRHRMVQAREAKRWKALVVALVGRRRPEKPLSRARLLCTRSSSSPADRVNIAQSCKALVDGLVAARVLLDDGPRNLVTEVYEWSPAPRGKGYVVLRVEEA